MATASLTVNVGVVKFTYTDTQWESLWSRSNPRALYRGPCLILNRQSGLALDATPGAKSGQRPLLWAAHAGPWQQWRIHPVGRGRVEVVSESSGLRLTTMQSPGDGTEVWLDDTVAKDWSQLWRLGAVEDRVAFVIQTGVSEHALDAGRDAASESSPHMQSAHQSAWQQWMIVRLPLT